jgi:hypothetical protein
MAVVNAALDKGWGIGLSRCPNAQVDEPQLVRLGMDNNLVLFVVQPDVLRKGGPRGRFE